MRKKPKHYRYNSKISFITHHPCTLDPLDLARELPGVAPFAPFHRKLLSKFSKWTIASNWNPNCRTYFRSHCALFKEWNRQLKSKKYRKIIHPLSRFAVVREFVVCLLWIVIFFLDPLASAFYASYIHRHTVLVHDLLRFVINALLAVDIVTQCFIGYIVDSTKEIVLDQRSIVVQYLSTFFFYDTIPVIYGFLQFLVRFESVKVFLSLPPDLDIWISIPQLYCLRFMRLHTVATYFYNILIFFRIKESFAKCATIALIVMIIIHWWTCVLYLVPVVSYYVGYPFSNSWVLRGILGTARTRSNVYIECLLCTICHFLGAGKGNITTSNPIEQSILALMLMCGVACHLYVIAVILHFFGTMNVSETKYEELIYQLNEYMATKKLPHALRRRLLMYYEYRFEKHFFLENVILNSLSQHLRFEVLLYSCRNLIEKVKLFQGASKEVIGHLVALLKHEIFLSDDIIIKPDAINENIYFISFGTVAAYSDNGKELYHLEDGHHFGEVQVILNRDEFKTSTVAIEITEVFYLDKRDFWLAVATHPEIADSLEKSALSKMATYKKLITDSENAMDMSDILMELRRGRILDKGRRRR